MPPGFVSDTLAPDRSSARELVLAGARDEVVERVEESR